MMNSKKGSRGRKGENGLGVAQPQGYSVHPDVPLKAESLMRSGTDWRGD